MMMGLLPGWPAPARPGPGQARHCEAGPCRAGPAGPARPGGKFGLGQALAVSRRSITMTERPARGRA